MIYTSDNDDVYMLQASISCDNEWNYNSRIFFPSNWNAERKQLKLQDALEEFEVDETRLETQFNRMQKTNKCSRCQIHP